MSLMDGPLSKEVRMLRACGKTKASDEGFWFWFTKVDDECVLIMRPRARDPEGAKMKGAVAKARMAVKKATRKSPRKFVTGEVYYENSSLRFYGNRNFPGFRDVLRDFAKDHKLRFLVGAKLYTGARGTVDLDDSSNIGDDEEVAEDTALLAEIPEDTEDFDVAAFLAEEVGAVQAVSARAKDLVLDPSIVLLTPSELKARVARKTEEAREHADKLRGLESRYRSLLLVMSPAPEQDAEFSRLRSEITDLKQQRDAALWQAEWNKAALPVEGEEAPEHISLDTLSRSQREERRGHLEEEVAGLESDLTAQDEKLKDTLHYRDKAARKAEHALGELRDMLNEKGISSAALGTLLATVKERARPEQDLKEGQQELDRLLAQYASLQERDTAKMGPDEAHSHLRRKLKLSQKLEEQRAYVKNRSAMIDMLDIERERLLAGGLEDRLRAEMAEAGLLEAPEVVRMLDKAESYRLNQEAAKADMAERSRISKRLAETTAERARATIYEDARAKGRAFRGNLSAAFTKDPALARLNPEKPSDLAKLKAALGDRAVDRLLRERQRLWARRDALAGQGASFAEQKKIFAGIPDNWLPLQLRESEQLFLDVSDFLDVEYGRSRKSKDEVRTESAGKALSSTGGGNTLLDGIDQDLSPKQQALVMKFSSQIVAVAAPIAGATGLADAVSGLTDDLTNSINDVFSGIAASSDQVDGFVKALSASVEIYSDVREIVIETREMTDRLKAASSVLRDLHGRLADSPEHSKVADRSLLMLKKVDASMQTADSILRLPAKLRYVLEPDQPELVSTVRDEHIDLDPDVEEIEAFVDEHRGLLAEVGGELTEINGLDPIEQMMMMEQLTSSLLEMAQGGVELTAGLIVGIVGQVPGLGIAINGLALIAALRKFAENMSRAVVNSRLHEEADEKLSVMEPTLDMIQDRDKRLAARRATEAAISALRIAADACTLSGVGAIATPALKGISEGLYAIKVVGTQIDELTTAQIAKDELQRAEEGDSLARKEIFRDDPRYAIGALAVMSKKDPPDDFAVRCLLNFGITREMITKGSASSIRRYLQLKLQVEDDPATWDDVAELTRHAVDRIGDGVAVMLTSSQQVYILITEQFVEDSPSKWMGQLETVHTTVQELGTHTSIVADYRRANARLWDTLAASEDLDDTAMARFKALQSDLETRLTDIEALRRRLVATSGQLRDMQIKMRAGPTSYGEVFAASLSAQMSMLTALVKDPQKALTYGADVWLKDLADQAQKTTTELNAIADRMAL